jgi:hypothetical protein
LYVERYFEVDVWFLGVLAPCQATKSGKNAHSATVGEEHVLIVEALARLLQAGKHAMIAKDLGR